MVDPGDTPHRSSFDAREGKRSSISASSTHGKGPATHLPALGKRGEGWVAGQLLLIAAVFLSALVGRSWAGGYAVAALSVGGVLLALGLVLLAWAGLRLGSSLTPFPAPRTDQSVQTTGPYGLVRHPMYGGGILIALGWSIVFATIVGLVLTLALGVFLDLKARREEVWLRERLDGYDDYRAGTPHKLLPFVY
jgi:protein-S-isoprenylcysteine O-methyltransferase Ste14